MDIRSSFLEIKEREDETPLSAFSHDAILKACKIDSNQKAIFYFKKQKIRESLISKKEVKSFFKDLFLIGEISRTEKDIMFSLISFWGEKGIFPNYQSIAIETRCSLLSAKRCTKKMKALGFLDWENRRIKKQQLSNKYFFTISEEEFERVKQKAEEVKGAAERAKKGESSEKRQFLKMFFQSIKMRFTRNNYNKYNYKNKVFKQSTDPVFISMENSVDSLQKSRLTLCDLVSRKYQALLKKSKEQAQIFLKATFSLNIYADTDENCSEVDLKRVKSELARLGVC